MHCITPPDHCGQTRHPAAHGHVSDKTESPLHGHQVAILPAKHRNIRVAGTATTQASAGTASPLWFCKLHPGNTTSHTTWTHLSCHALMAWPLDTYHTSYPANTPSIRTASNTRHAAATAYQTLTTTAQPYRTPTHNPCMIVTVCTRTTCMIISWLLHGVCHHTLKASPVSLRQRSFCSGLQLSASLFRLSRTWQRPTAMPNKG